MALHRYLLVVVLVSSSLGLIAANAQPDRASRVDTISNKTFDETVKHLEWQIGGHGMTVTSAIDYRSVLKKKGKNIPGAVMFEVMRAQWASEVLTHDPIAALALPLRIYAVEKNDGTIMVSYLRPSVILGASSDPGIIKLGIMLDEKLASVVSLATK